MEPNFNQTNEMFKKMAQDGVDLSKEQQWGFFFIDKSEVKLKAVFQELCDHNYKFESLHQTEDGDWVAQFAKIEVLTAEKLHKRNIAFNDLAAHFDVELYDGWDVTPINKKNG